MFFFVVIVGGVFLWWHTDTEWIYTNIRLCVCTCMHNQNEEQKNGNNTFWVNSQVNIHGAYENTFSKIF